MRLKWVKSITFQLTVLFATASTVVLLSLGVLIGNSVDRHFENQDMEVLAGKLALARHAVEKVASPSDLMALPQQLDDSLIGHQSVAVVVVGPDGRTLYATRDAEFPPALLDRNSPTDSTSPVVWRVRGDRPFRGISAVTATGIAGLPPAVVAVATDISQHEHFNASFRARLWSFVIAAAFVTGILGWFAARRGLAPFTAIKRKAADITAHRLHARLPADAVPVELLDLVETLNAMLARLESSFAKLSDFSSDIAHELRTPVSNLLTQTQVTLSKDRAPEEYRDVLASNVEEFERLSRMISDMLFLAKSDNQLIVPHREQLDLAGEVQGLIEFYEALAEDRAIVLTCSGSGHVSGDRLMLRRAISNLLSNAVRYTPAGGRISIRLDDSGENAVKLSVANTGQPIPAEHLPRLFDRFYRVDTSRRHFTDGAGLGLAITRSILHAHGGEARVRSDAGGTVFELIIPIQTTA